MFTGNVCTYMSTIDVLDHEYCDEKLHVLYAHTPTSLFNQMLKRQPNLGSEQQNGKHTPAIPIPTHKHEIAHIRAIHVMCLCEKERERERVFT